MDTTPPELVLRLGEVEIRTTDPLACRVAWRLMATAVPDSTLAALADPRSLA